MLRTMVLLALLCLVLPSISSAQEGPALEPQLNQEMLDLMHILNDRFSMGDGQARIWAWGTGCFNEYNTEFQWLAWTNYYGLLVIQTDQTLPTQKLMGIITLGPADQCWVAYNTTKERAWLSLSTDTCIMELGKDWSKDCERPQDCNYDALLLGRLDKLTTLGLNFTIEEVFDIDPANW